MLAVALFFPNSKCHFLIIILKLEHNQGKIDLDLAVTGALSENRYIMFVDWEKYHNFVFGMIEIFKNCEKSLPIWKQNLGLLFRFGEQS